MSGAPAISWFSFEQRMKNFIYFALNHIATLAGARSLSAQQVEHIDRLPPSRLHLSGGDRLFAFVFTITFAFCFVNPGFAQQSPSIRWGAILNQPSTWYASTDALRVADNVLLYQRNSGGWPKNIDMASELTDHDRAELTARKTETDSTIDNGATYTQMQFLAKVYEAQPQSRHLNAFIKGFDYLLKAQYDNGGWPQFYPDLNGYYRHITFNDEAMIGVMKLLHDVANKKAAYSFVDEERRAKARRAVQKGLECILKTQLIIDGRRTVWCAQYDEVTLKPAAARKYELVSLSGLESVGIVRFLMAISQPDTTVIEAIEGAIAWFQKSQLNGIRWVEKKDASQPNGFDRVVVNDPDAPPLWARFYELNTNRPMFVGRDSVVKYEVAAIEHERRTGYAWYTEEPARLLNKDYPEWRKNNGR
jgi:PelA/Pel-15E family pectate lyase